MLTDYGKLHVSVARHAAVRPDGFDAAVREWRAALARGEALRVRGSGHGLSGASLPRQDETLFLTRGLDRYRVVAPGLLAVGSGAIVWDIRDFVAQCGMRLPIYNGGWAGPTLGGFVCAGGLGLRVPPSERESLIAAGAAGKTDKSELASLSEKYGGLWAQVAELTMIDGRGRLHSFRPGDRDFPWIFASMGQFGLLLEVTLRIYRRPGEVADLPVGRSGRIPVSNPLNPNETDRLPPADGIDWVYWFTALVPPGEEEAAWKIVGNWSDEHRDTLRPTGGWVGPLQEGVPIGFRYLVRHKAPPPPMLYPREEDFLVLGVMAVCSGIGTDPAEAALRRAERAFVAQIVDRGWSLYCQAENLTRSLDFRSYLGPDRWARFCELKTRFDPEDRINVGEVRPGSGPPPLDARRVRQAAAAVRRVLAPQRSARETRSSDLRA
ncbi:MAG: FAD-binding protein [Defluviicoccus sp.]|nr:FAD-binding protein [Defluviicoccus sp.]